jgi:5-methylcytosine-specific restriction endonuclease McrA
MTIIVAGEMKQCSRCKTEYPATSQFFGKSSHGDRNGLHCYCRLCIAEKAKEYRAAHPDQWKSPAQAASRKKYYDKWYAAHGLEYHREWKRKHADEVNVRRRADPTRPDKAREYRESHVESCKARATAWRKNNPDMVRARKSRRRSLERNALGTFTAADVQDMYQRQEGRCLYCNKDVGDDYHVDHYIPLARGGTNLPLNIVIACPSCNKSKNQKLPSEFVFQTH